jgi:hypothetical protein
MRYETQNKENKMNSDKYVILSVGPLTSTLLTPGKGGNYSVEPVEPADIERLRASYEIMSTYKRGGRTHYVYRII